MAEKKKIISCRSKHVKGAIEIEKANTWYNYLKENIVWEEGVRSKLGFTRLAKSVTVDDFPEVYEMIIDVLNKIKSKVKYILLGIYINYYTDGNMWCPNHTHPGTHQIVISLGATRKFHLGKKDILVENGDAVIFGSAVHGLPKDEAIKEGRISIAVLLLPIASE